MNADNLHNMQFRVGTCGWPAACFDPRTGEQLYTPDELERAAQDDNRYCPPGLCMPSRDGQLTGWQPTEAEASGRSLLDIMLGRNIPAEPRPQVMGHEMLPPMRRGPVEEPTRYLPPPAPPEISDGTWQRMSGGVEVKAAPAHDKGSLWDWLTGK